MKKIFIPGLILLLFLCAAKFPKPVGYVNDFANIISYQYENKISSLITDLEQKTTAEIAVVTIQSLAGETVESYAVDLFEKWGIGKKGKDNGVLLLIALGERKVRIEVGYGLEGILPDGLCGEIIRQKIIPNFKKGNYDEGIWQAVATISNIIAKDAGILVSQLEKLPPSEYKLSKRVKRSRLLSNLLFLFFFFIFFSLRIFLFPFFLGGGYWSSGGGGFGGGFGGFGGGMSGGGGASGGW